MNRFRIAVVIIFLSSCVLGADAAGPWRYDEGRRVRVTAMRAAEGRAERDILGVDHIQFAEGGGKIVIKQRITPESAPISADWTFDAKNNTFVRRDVEPDTPELRDAWRAARERRSRDVATNTLAPEPRGFRYYGYFYVFPWGEGAGGWLMQEGSVAFTTCPGGQIRANEKPTPACRGRCVKGEQWCSLTIKDTCLAWGPDNTQLFENGTFQCGVSGGYWAYDYQMFQGASIRHDFHVSLTFDVYNTATVIAQYVIKYEPGLPVPQHAYQRVLGEIGPVGYCPPATNGTSGDCSLPDDDPNIGTGTWTELAEVSTECGNNSPIVIDVAGDGFALTDAAGGVFFDLNSDGPADLLSWTAAGSDDAFLVLDRNANGIIDNGRELFGNFTPQLPGGEANGFRALAVYDRPISGGNGDGAIDARDQIFASLRLWQDANHNGISEAFELHPLPAFAVERLHLDYKESRKVDDHGNAFRYRAKIDGKNSDAGRWAWDVFLVRQ